MVQVGPWKAPPAISFGDSVTCHNHVTLNVLQGRRTHSTRNLGHSQHRRPRYIHVRQPGHSVLCSRLTPRCVFSRSRFDTGTTRVGAALVSSTAKFECVYSKRGGEVGSQGIAFETFHSATLIVKSQHAEQVRHDDTPTFHQHHLYQSRV